MTLGFLTLGTTNLQAATRKNVSAPVLKNQNSVPNLTTVANTINTEEHSLQPMPSPEHESSPSPNSEEEETHTFGIDNIKINFRNDLDNSGIENQFLEPTAQFHLKNGNTIQIKTGFNTFHQPEIDKISNIPLTMTYHAEIEPITLQFGVGLDLFNRLPTAVNLNAEVDVAVSPRLTLAVIVNQGLDKQNARTLSNQITFWQYGINANWDISPKTNLYSEFYLNNYNDGNFQQQSSTTLGHKFGIFSVAANLSNSSYTHDFQEKSGYYSPADLLSLSEIIALEGDIFKFLHCRVATTLGRQRIEGKFGSFNTYESRCTTKISPTLETDFSYTYSTSPARNPGENSYNNRSFIGELRLKF